MSYSCPLNFKPVDSNTSRISALLVASLVITYLITLHEFILIFLIMDFSVKLFMRKELSVIYNIALPVRNLFKIQEKLTDGGAKRLAAMFGLIFVVSLFLTHVLNLATLSLIVAGIFLTCSLLDVFLDYCLGCKIFFIIKKIYPSFME